VPVPAFGPQMICTRCGIVGADARSIGKVSGGLLVDVDTFEHHRQLVPPRHRRYQSPLQRYPGFGLQRARARRAPRDDGSVADRKVVMGALSLYLDFINMFMHCCPVKC
jgi:FtsH-binding integral membrane protein